MSQSSLFLNRPVSSSDPHQFFAKDLTYIPDTNSSKELLMNLKSNYLERIQNLENHLKETYQLIETDEIVETMKMSQVSDHFRKQRIQEILEKSLISEKEAEIERLSYLNAVLQTNLGQLEADKNQSLQTFNSESANHQKKINELKHIIQNESQIKSQLQQECDILSNTFTKFVEEHEDILRQNENDKDQLQNEINELKKELLRQRENSEAQQKEGFYKTRHSLEDINKLRDDLKKKNGNLVEMRTDMEMLKNEYLVLEEVNNELRTEQCSYVKALSQYKENITQSEVEIINLRKQLNKAEDENKIKTQELERISQENSDLISRSEYISSQVKKLVENGQKNASEMIEEMKVKYKRRIEEQNNKIEEINILNEKSRKEIAVLQKESSESRSKYDAAVVQHKNDLKYVKDEWERKCQNFALQSQNELIGAQAQYQSQVSKLQNKIKQIQEEAKKQIELVKNTEGGVRKQLESKVLKFEQDYIPKSTHENILSSEILNLKTSYIDKLKDVESTYEKDHSRKFQEAIEKQKRDYENILTTCQEEKKKLEQEVTQLKVEYQITNEKFKQEKQKTRSLQESCDELKSAQTDLKEEIIVVTQNLANIKGLHEEELKKRKRADIEIEDLLLENEVMSRNRIELSQRVVNLEGRIEEMRETMSLQNQKINEFSNQNKLLINENEILKIGLEASEKEKTRISIKLSEVEYEHDLHLQSSKNLQESLEKMEKKADESEKNQNSFSQMRAEVDKLSREIEEKRLKIESIDFEKRNFERLYQSAQQNENNLNEELIKWKQISLELQRRMQNDLRKVKASLKESIKQNIYQLRQDNNELKREIKTKFEQTMSGTGPILKILAKSFINQVSLQNQKNSEKLYEERNKTIAELNRQNQEQGKLYEHSERESKKLMKTITNLKEELMESTGRTEDVVKKYSKYEEKIQKLEEEKNRMRLDGIKKVDEFQKLQFFVQNELRRLKDDSENVSTQIKERYQHELSILVMTVDCLKGKKIEKMRKIQEDVSQLTQEHEDDFGQLKMWYESRVNDFKDSLSEANGIINVLNTSLRKAEEMNKELKLENRELIDNLEEKLKIVRDMINKENPSHDSIAINRSSLRNVDINTEFHREEPRKPRFSKTNNGREPYKPKKTGFGSRLPDIQQENQTIRGLSDYIKEACEFIKPEKDDLYKSTSRKKDLDVKDLTGNEIQYTD